MVTLHKMGYNHIKQRRNCQDIAIGYTTEDNIEIKLVCDGCSSTPFAEVGAITFAKVFKETYTNSKMSIPETATEVFKKILDLFSGGNNQKYDEIINLFMSFTILICIEKEDKFITYTCGDGVIISYAQTGEVEYTILKDHPTYPKYLAYKFMQNREALKGIYDDEIEFVENIFDKEKYLKVGISSDGIEYMLTEYQIPIREEFELYLFKDTTATTDKERAKNIFNLLVRNEALFDDDFSLAI